MYTARIFSGSILAKGFVIGIIAMLLSTSIITINPTEAQSVVHSFESMSASDDQEGFIQYYDQPNSEITWGESSIEPNNYVINWESRQADGENNDEFFVKSIPTTITRETGSFTLSADINLHPDSEQGTHDFNVAIPLFIGSDDNTNLLAPNTFYFSIVKLIDAQGTHYLVGSSFIDCNNVNHIVLEAFPLSFDNGNKFTVSLQYMAINERFYCSLADQFGDLLYDDESKPSWSDYVIKDKNEDFTFNWYGTASYGANDGPSPCPVTSFLKGTTDNIAIDFETELWTLDAFDGNSNEEYSHSEPNLFIFGPEDGSEDEFNEVFWKTEGREGTGKLIHFIKWLPKRINERQGDFFAEYDFGVTRTGHISSDGGDWIIPLVIGDVNPIDYSIDDECILFAIRKEFGEESPLEFVIQVNYFDNSGNFQVYYETILDQVDENSNYHCSVYYSNEANSIYVEIINNHDNVLLRQILITNVNGIRFEFNAISVMIVDDNNENVYGLEGYTDNIITDLFDFTPQYHLNHEFRLNSIIWQNNINSPILWHSNHDEPSVPENLYYLKPTTNVLKSDNCPPFSIEYKFQVNEFNELNNAVSVFPIFLSNEDDTVWLRGNIRRKSQDPNHFTLFYRYKGINQDTADVIQLDGIYPSLETHVLYTSLIQYNQETNDIYFALSDSENEWVTTYPISTDPDYGFEYSKIGVGLKSTISPGWDGLTQDIQLFGGISEHPRYFSTPNDIVHERARRFDDSNNYLSYDYVNLDNNDRELYVTAQSIYSDTICSALQVVDSQDEQISCWNDIPDKEPEGYQNSDYETTNNLYMTNLRLLSLAYLLTDNYIFQSEIDTYIDTLNDNADKWDGIGDERKFMRVRGIMASAAIGYDSTYYCPLTFSRENVRNTILICLRSTYELNNLDSTELQDSNLIPIYRSWQGIGALLLLGDEHPDHSTPITPIEVYRWHYFKEDNEDGKNHCSWISVNYFFRSDKHEGVEENKISSILGPDGGYNEGINYYSAIMHRTITYSDVLTNVISVKRIKAYSVYYNDDWNIWNKKFKTGIPHFDDDIEKFIVYFIYNYAKVINSDYLNLNTQYPLVTLPSFDDGSDNQMGVINVFARSIGKSELTLPGLNVKINNYAQWLLKDSGVYHGHDMWGSIPQTSKTRFLGCNPDIRFTTFNPSITPYRPTSNKDYSNYFQSSMEFPIIGIVTIRSGWESIWNNEIGSWIPPSVFVIKSGEQSKWHSHANQNGIVLNSHGTRYISENGYADKTPYESKSEYHSTMNFLENAPGELELTQQKHQGEKYDGVIRFHGSHDKYSLTQGEFNQYDGEILDSSGGYVRSIYNIDSSIFALYDHINLNNENYFTNWQMYTHTAYDDITTFNDEHLFQFSSSDYSTQCYLDIWGTSTNGITSIIVGDTEIIDGSLRGTPRNYVGFRTSEVGDVGIITLLMPAIHNDGQLVTKISHESSTGFKYSNGEGLISVIVADNEKTTINAIEDEDIWVNFAGYSASLSERNDANYESASIINGWYLQGDTKVLLQFERTSSDNDAGTAFSVLDENERTIRCNFRITNGDPSRVFLYCPSGQTIESIFLDGVIVPSSEYIHVGDQIKINIPSNCRNDRAQHVYKLTYQ